MGTVMESGRNRAALEQRIRHFDDAWYLRRYEDVAKAVEAREWPSAKAHFLRCGMAEGRRPFEFDEGWYLKSYPMASYDVARFGIPCYEDHFLALGANRGYLPNPRAPRPAPVTSRRFAGLWIDEPGAIDSIEGSVRAGLITSGDANLLRHFHEKGYVVIERAVPEFAVAAARRELEQIYEGRYPSIKFECPALGRATMPWREEFSRLAAKALDTHMSCQGIRDVMFAPGILRFLQLLFHHQPLASQTLAFLRGSGQEPHQDSAYVPYTIPRAFAASWIALEDVAEGAGELYYYPGSHNFPDYIYPSGQKSVSEARRLGASEPELQQCVREHVQLLPKWASEMHLETETFRPKAGDALIWHADLAHGGSPVSKELTRKSLVTHYCGANCVPLYAEQAPLRLQQHWSGGFYTSGHPE